MERVAVEAILEGRQAQPGGRRLALDETAAVLAGKEELALRGGLTRTGDDTASKGVVGTDLEMDARQRFAVRPLPVWIVPVPLQDLEVFLRVLGGSGLFCLLVAQFLGALRFL